MKEAIQTHIAFRIVLAGVGVLIVTSAVYQWMIGPYQEDSGLWNQFSDEPLNIEARGRDREWRFSYEGPDGILGTDDDPQSTGELRLPTGTEVVLNLRSDDFIYMFSCPGLKLKEIAVPELEFSIAFQVNRLGEFDLLMDPLCGFRLPPGKTMGKISVASGSDFRQWLLDHYDPLNSLDKSSQ